MTVATRSRTALTVIATVAALLPAARAAADPPTIDGHHLTPDGTMTAWSGTGVGNLLVNDSSTAGGITVLGMRNDRAGCASGNGGAAQILRSDGIRWTAEQRLLHPEPVDGNPPDRPGIGCYGEFGESVSTDGTRIAVAARLVAGDPLGQPSGGAVYIYARTAGEWTRTARVRVPADAQVDAVTIDGGRLAVSTTAPAGSRVYLFMESPTGWNADGSLMGLAPLAMHGDELVLSSGGGGTSPSTLLFAQRTGSGWSSAPMAGANINTNIGDNRGLFKVLFDGASATVAARLFRAGAATDAVQVFQRWDGGWWNREAEIVDPDAPGVLSLFGWQGISRDGDNLLVGASAEAGGATPPGAAYLFGRQPDGSWSLQQRYRPADPGQEQGFGYAVALHGNVAGVLSRDYNAAWGAWFSFDPSGTPTGAINHPLQGNGSGLGASVAVEGDLAAGLTGEPIPVAGQLVSDNHGSVQLFRRTATGWTDEARLISPGSATPSQPGLTANIRRPVAIHNGSVYAIGTTLAAGGFWRSVVLRFDRTGPGWALSAQIPVPDQGAPSISDLDFAGDTMVMSTESSYSNSGRVDFYRESNGVWTRSQNGAYSASTPRAALNSTADLLAYTTRQSGTVSVWRRTGNTWGPLASFVTPFPDAVAPLPVFTGDNALAVADPYGSSCADGTCSGKVAVFRAAAGSPTNWQQEAVFGGTAGSYEYGAGVAAAGAALLISRQDARGFGHVDVVERGGAGWSTTGTLDPPVAQAFDYYGEALAVDGVRVVAGAYATNSPAGDGAGAVFAYRIDTAPPVTVPPAPGGVTVVAGDHSATITWVKPASDGGAPITGYTVIATPGGQSCSTVGADALTCTIGGLANGVNFTFTVTAHNAAGAGPPATTPPGQPVVVGVPPGPVVVLPPEPDPVDGTRVTLHWLAAASDPNLPVVGYRATAEPGGQFCTTTGALSCTITGLTPGVSYSFTVVAVNAAGPSPTTPPGAPAAVAATAGGYAQAVVSWTAPASTGGSPITGYTVTAGPGGASCTTSGALACTVAGLTPGTAYVFTVVAATGQGQSPPSQPSAAFTPAVDVTVPVVTGVPDRVPDVSVGGQGWWRGPVTVTWKATDGGSGVAGPPPPPVTVSAQGASDAASALVCDVAGNCAVGGYPVRIDSQGPTVTVTGVADHAVYTLGAVPAAGCAATDATLGVDGACTVTVTGGNASHVGAYAVTATARDRAGNVTTVIVRYEVHYAWAGFAQPINDTTYHSGQSLSVFKAGSTVPVKFTVTAGGQVVAPLWVAPLRGVSTTLPIDESVYGDAPDTGAAYRLTDGQWQYNWKTDKAQAGSYWRIGVRLDDGTTRYVDIALR